MRYCTSGEGVVDNFCYQWNTVCQTLFSKRWWDWIKTTAVDRIYNGTVNSFLRNRFKL